MNSGILLLIAAVGKRDKYVGKGNDLPCWVCLAKVSYIPGEFSDFPCFSSYTSAVNEDHKNRISEVIVYHNCCNVNKVNRTLT